HRAHLATLEPNKGSHDLPLTWLDDSLWEDLTLANDPAADPGLRERARDTFGRQFLVRRPALAERLYTEELTRALRALEKPPEGRPSERLGPVLQILKRNGLGDRPALATVWRALDYLTKSLPREPLKYEWDERRRDPELAAYFRTVAHFHREIAQEIAGLKD